MQSVVRLGSFITRAVVTNLSEESRFITRWYNYAQRTVPRPLSLVTASSGISKGISQPNIVSKWSFGDDAYFVAKGGTADVIGVADGVGGWREYGIDPSQFPRTLMSICERLVTEGIIRPQEPKDIISKGYKELLENKSHLVGSCTACLVALDKEEKTLYSANLGDSGFLVIRRGKVVHRSEEQQHYFNTPFQLAVAPAVLEGMVLADSPDAADAQSFDVEVGDIVVVGTDGLFDNMSDDLILHHTSSLKGSKQECVQRVANALAEEAHELAFDTEYMSPFALQAAANGFTIKELNKDPVEGFSAGLIDDEDLYRWEVLVIGPPDTFYEGGFFKAHLTFPKDYPQKPPKLQFISDIWHPNIDKSGDVCISILHDPGEDKWGYERPEERWLPIHTVTTIMMSVISMLADPNDESPANIDAAKEWRNSREEFRKKVARCVRKSQEEA